MQVESGGGFEWLVGAVWGPSGACTATVPLQFWGWSAPRAELGAWKATAGCWGGLRRPGTGTGTGDWNWSSLSLPIVRDCTRLTALLTKLATKHLESPILDPFPTLRIDTRPHDIPTCICPSPEIFTNKPHAPRQHALRVPARPKQATLPHTLCCLCLCLSLPGKTRACGCWRKHCTSRALGSMTAAPACAPGPSMGSGTPTLTHGRLHPRGSADWRN